MSATESKGLYNLVDEYYQKLYVDGQYTNLSIYGQEDTKLDTFYLNTAHRAQDMIRS